MGKVSVETARGAQAAAAATVVAASRQGANCRLRSASPGSWLPARLCCARPRSARRCRLARSHRRERLKRCYETVVVLQLAAPLIGAALPRLRMWTP